MYTNTIIGDRKIVCVRMNDSLHKLFYSPSSSDKYQNQAISK
jgi:hypothetical protein